MKKILVAALAFMLPLAGCSSDPDIRTPDNVQTSQNSGESTAGKEPENEKVPDSYVKVDGDYYADTVLTVKGLPCAKAVQQIAFYEENGKEYVFATQRDAASTYLSRCEIDWEKKTATKVDFVLLSDYGHGESLDISVHNGEAYVFVGSSANKKEGSNYWSTEITRFKYDAGKMTDAKTLTGFGYMSEDGSLLFEGATAYRVIFGMDDEADAVAVYVKFDTDHDNKIACHRMTSYRLSDIHALLDAAESSVSLADCADAHLATTGNVKADRICENGSCQGIEVGPDGVVLITGGSVGKSPTLSRFETGNGVISRTEVAAVGGMSSLRMGDWNFAASESYVEIESIKYYKENYYCLFTPVSASDKQNYTEIYVIARYTGEE